MNKIFKVIFDRKKNACVVVSEFAKNYVGQSGSTTQSTSLQDKMKGLGTCHRALKSLRWFLRYPCFQRVMSLRVQLRLVSQLALLREEVAGTLVMVTITYWVLLVRMVLN